MRKSLFGILLIISLLNSCLNEPEMTVGVANLKEEPTVASVSDNIPEDGRLVFYGNLKEEGKGGISMIGFCWSLSTTEPTFNDSVISVNPVQGLFTGGLTQALGDTVYYWRAFATNRYGISYGDVHALATPSIWQEKDEFRSYLRLRFASFAINNNFYIVCGDNYTTTFSDTWEYDISLNKWWGTAPNYPGEARRYPATFVIGDSAYVGTGQSSSATAYNDFYIFDGKIKIWNTSPITAPFDVRFQAMAFSLDNKGYVLGGQFLGRSMDDVWQYSYASGTGQWTQMNDFPVNIYGGICVSDGKRAFAGFGDNADARATLWEYNAASDAWTEFASLPEGMASKFFSAALLTRSYDQTEYLYAVDGDNMVWELDLQTRRWSEKRMLPEVFLFDDGTAGNQTMLVAPNGSAVYVGLGFKPYFYAYHPFWDN
ncbi:MAG: hypothetical protein LBR64_00110 [Dysgonamonadaceae bacterium]|jgi:hypothetical protein|nr:hypothetical protein [Dysgonamonadaceae bacterium]